MARNWRALGDDDSRIISLPFPFPFYGHTYRTAYVNSDGNLTFVAGDTDITARSFGRMVAGSPRISALFSDLDPSSATGSGRGESLHRARPRGGDLAVGAAILRHRIRAAADLPDPDAGQRQHRSRVRHRQPHRRRYRNLAGRRRRSHFAGVAGRVTSRRIHRVPWPISSAAAILSTSPSQPRRFYETHDDAYDYLVFFNSVDVGPRPAQWRTKSRSAINGLDTAMRSKKTARSSAPHAGCRP